MGASVGIMIAKSEVSFSESKRYTGWPKHSVEAALEKYLSLRENEGLDGTVSVTFGCAQLDAWPGTFFGLTLEPWEQGMARVRAEQGAKAEAVQRESELFAHERPLVVSSVACTTAFVQRNVQKGICSNESGGFEEKRKRRPPVSRLFRRTGPAQAPGSPADCGIKKDWLLTVVGGRSPESVAEVTQVCVADATSEVEFQFHAGTFFRRPIIPLAFESGGDWCLGEGTMERVLESHRTRVSLLNHPKSESVTRNVPECWRTKRGSLRALDRRFLHSRRRAAARALVPIQSTTASERGVSSLFRAFRVLESRGGSLSPLGVPFAKTNGSSKTNFRTNDDDDVTLDGGRVALLKEGERTRAGCGISLPRSVFASLRNIPLSKTRTRVPPTKTTRVGRKPPFSSVRRPHWMHVFTDATETNDRGECLHVPLQAMRPFRESRV